MPPAILVFIRLRRNRGNVEWEEALRGYSWLIQLLLFKKINTDKTYIHMITVECLSPIPIPFISCTKKNVHWLNRVTLPLEEMD